jgi:demethylmenaquinone methyltransferase/2-methoxy-6-polyprenyl-1,4-benzoquinol methylase
MRQPQRYTSFAPAYEVLSGEWPVYRAGRVTGIGALQLRPGALVLDIGCGTGLNIPLIREVVGPTGRIVGVDASANMLAQARAKAQRRGWLNIDLKNADATTLTPGWLDGHLGPEHGPDGAEAVLFTYSLSVMTNWPKAWRAATDAARPGARVAVVDLRRPTGPATALAPLACLACTLGGSDITAHPWTALERDCTDVQAWSLRGGHIQVRAGTLKKP